MTALHISLPTGQPKGKTGDLHIATQLMHETDSFGVDKEQNIFHG